MHELFPPYMNMKLKLSVYIFNIYIYIYKVLSRSNIECAVQLYIYIIYFLENYLWCLSCRSIKHLEHGLICWRE